VDAIYRFNLFTALLFTLLVLRLRQLVGASAPYIGRLLVLYLPKCGARFCSDSLLRACSRAWRETSSMDRSRINDDRCIRSGTHFICSPRWWLAVHRSRLLFGKYLTFVSVLVRSEKNHRPSTLLNASR
jgi:hypothetical protein